MLSKVWTLNVRRPPFSCKCSCLKTNCLFYSLNRSQIANHNIWLVLYDADWELQTLGSASVTENPQNLQTLARVTLDVFVSNFSNSLPKLKVTRKTEFRMPFLKQKISSFYLSLFKKANHKKPHQKLQISRLKSVLRNPDGQRQAAGNCSWKKFLNRVPVAGLQLAAIKCGLMIAAWKPTHGNIMRTRCGRQIARA